MPQVAIGAAIAGGAVATAGSVAALTGASLAFFQLGTGLVLSGISAQLAPKLPGPTARVSARQPVAPREIVYGQVRKGGTIVYLDYGKDQGLLNLVIILAAHEVEHIGAIYFNGERAILDGETQGQNRFNGRASVRRHLGAPGDNASGIVLDSGGKWTTDHRLSGVAAIGIELGWDENVYPTGLPNITADVTGRKVYDPRASSTLYRDNPALCLADYMADATFGLGATYGADAGIDTASLIEAANICEEAVTLAAGGTEERYTTNGIVDTSRPPKENIEALLTAMAGHAVYVGGRWHIRAGAYRTPSLTLTSDDVREAGLSVQTRRSRSDNFNGVRGQFVSPENDWQPDDFPAYQSDVYVAEDQGVESWRDIALPFTTSAATAQRLAKIELERMRRQQVARVSGKLSAWRAVTGDTVNLTYDRWGWASKPFDVRKVALSIQDGSLVPEIVLSEVSPLQYDWSASEEQIYAAAPQTNLPNPFDIDPPGAPDITEELYQTRDGTSVRTKLIVTWAASPDPFVTLYQVQAWGPDDSTWRTWGRTDQTIIEILDVKAGTWKVRVAAISGLGVFSAYAEAQAGIAGVSAPPVALTGVTLQKAGGIALLKWALPTDLDVRAGGRVVIRHSASSTPSWANSVSMDEVPGNQTIASVPLKPGSYLLRAQDAGGLLGPIATVGTDGAQAVAFVSAATSLTGETAWIGTKTNTEVNVFDQLTLTDRTIEGVYQFATGFDFTTVKTVRFRSVIDVTAENTALLFDDMEGLFDDAIGDFDQTDGSAIDVVVEGRFTDDDPAGTPTWTDWTRIDSSEVKCRGAQFRARLFTLNDSFNILLTGLSVEADEVS